MRVLKKGNMNAENLAYVLFLNIGFHAGTHGEKDR